MNKRLTRVKRRGPIAAREHRETRGLADARRRRLSSRQDGLAIPNSPPTEKIQNPAKRNETSFRRPQNQVRGLPKLDVLSQSSPRHPAFGSPAERTFGAIPTTVMMEEVFLRGVEDSSRWRRTGPHSSGIGQAASWIRRRAAASVARRPGFVTPEE